MEEIWKDVLGYKGLYQVSNFGRVKSMARVKSNGFRVAFEEERILSSARNNDKMYDVVILCNDGNKKHFRVHCLVWDHFSENKRNGSILQVDHIDNNKRNNRFDNLQLLSQRDNTIKSKNNPLKTGTNKEDCKSKWRSVININKKRIHIGYFNTQEEAYQAYLKKREELLCM